MQIKELEYYCEKEKQTTCPFSGRPCNKIKRTEIGICSVFHANSQQIICPSLFDKIDFKKIIAESVLKTDEYETIKEAKIGQNYIDYILVDRNRHSNYCGVEVQALDTTGNYKWSFGEKTKPFCINWKTTKKTIISQIISKSILFEKNNKKIVLVLQDTFAKYLKIDSYEYDAKDNIQVMILKYDEKKLFFSKFISLNMNNLFKIFDEEYSGDLESYIEKNLKNIKK